MASYLLFTDIGIRVKTDFKLFFAALYSILYAKKERKVNDKCHIGGSVSVIYTIAVREVIRWLRLQR